MGRDKARCDGSESRKCISPRGFAACEGRLFFWLSVRILNEGDASIMGYDFANDLRANFPEDMALRYHFIYNHSPRISLEFLRVRNPLRDAKCKHSFRLPN